MSNHSTDIECISSLLSRSKVEPLSTEDVPVDRMDILLEGATFSYNKKEEAKEKEDATIDIDVKPKKRRRSSIRDKGLEGLHMHIAQGISFVECTKGSLI